MSESKATTLDVEGMSCASCVRHVEGALRTIDGVGAIEVELQNGKVHVQHDPAKATIEQMVAALSEAGYDSRLSA